MLMGACLGLLATAALAQSIETSPLDSPEEQDESVIDRSKRFQRAPFRTYSDNVGPAKPSPIDQSDTFVQLGARIRELDKMTGEIETIDIASGDEAVLGRLRIRVESCRTEDEQGLTGAISLMKIWDARGDRQEPAFSGWMFADSPALSALDHPRYDVWVLSCITASGGTSSASE
ncbi:DUF2155 domain-containing protein [Rhodobacteraceae bacterium NNCM2]|nr:DUF2155 domain-containing protein [Coraliihabitans acroporae]